MIIDVIIQWGFDDTPIAELAREILLKTDTQKAIAALIKLIQSSHDEGSIEYLASILEEIAPKNKQVITALIELVQDSKNELIIYYSVKSLGRIGHKNSLVITALIELIKSCKNFDFDTIEEVVYELGQIGKGNDHAITALIEFLQCSEDEFVIYVIVDSLGEIVQDSSQAERVINSLRESLKDELIFKNALDSFLERYCKEIIEEPLPIAITSLNQLLRSSKNFDFDIIHQVVYSLDNMGELNHHATAELIKNLESSLKSSKDVVIVKGLLDAVKEIEQGINQAKREINSLRESLKNELIFENVLNGFLYNYCSKIQKEALRKVLKLKSVKYLKENNEKEIMSLIELIQFSQDKVAINRAVRRLGEIKQCNEQVITTLVSLIQSSPRKDFLVRPAAQSLTSLTKIIVKDQMPRIITALKNGLSEKTYTDDSYRHESCFLVLWQCAQTLSYPEFYKAWHSQPKIIHPEILEISPLGNTAITQTLNQQIIDLPSQLQPTEKTYPLVINAKSLEKMTSENSLSQSLCNKIYKIIFPQITDIPKVNNPSDLEREIIKIKGQIQKQNLALIFHKGEPKETLVNVCEQLTDEIYYKFITNEPIERGFSLQKNPENPVEKLQNWINQLD